jgi:hypothetical protein
VRNEFWDSANGKKFTGDFLRKEEGTILPNKQAYARLEGKAGEVLLL